MRLTYADLKAAASWTQALNLCVTDARFLQYLNQALPRLMNHGRYVGLNQKYAVCTAGSFITLPRRFQTAEVMDVCKYPVQIRNGWFEFLENGPGRVASQTDCAGNNAYDRGHGFAGFADLPYAQTKIRLVPTLGADATKTVTIRGTNSSGDYVLTNSGAIDGEKMTLAFPFVDSTTIWGKQEFRTVLKDVTKGFVKAYAYDYANDPGATNLTQLALWEPSETLPDYRRYEVPMVTAIKKCSSCQNAVDYDCADVSVIVMARIAFVPIVNDLDVLPIGNVEAIKLAMLAVMKTERNDFQGAQIAMYGGIDPVRRTYVNGAIPLLEDELDAEQGAGTVAPLRLDGFGISGPGIQNLI